MRICLRQCFTKFTVFFKRLWEQQRSIQYWLLFTVSVKIDVTLNRKTSAETVGLKKRLNVGV